MCESHHTSRHFKPGSAGKVGRGTPDDFAPASRNTRPGRFSGAVCALAMLSGLALLPLPAVAAEWTLMGVGACRTLAGTNVTPISALRNVSWNACRQMCEQNEGCFGVEFNLRNDRSICELHGTQVKAGPSGANDRVLTCWGKDVPVVE